MHLAVSLEANKLTGFKATNEVLVKFPSSSFLKSCFCLRRMEGVLYKWTNYMTGWQPRWFVLDNGIISYYDSQDDVCKGSKGSIKMSVCEIKVHQTDNTRLELIIPGEQHFYVKAVNAAERQKWLVALGSSKAGLIDTRTKKERELTETTESLKTKMSELRLYCDLLMQQVHTIQESVEQEGGHSETRNEASSLLSATCNTFIQTLEECMKIANSKFQTDMLQSSPSDPLMSPVSPSPIQMMKRSISHPGTYSYDRSSVPKECMTVHRSSQRRTRTCSDTEALNDGGTEEMERLVLFPKASLNGDAATVIPEEISTGTRFGSETDTPESDLSL
ncbi:pleckstrin homology domain-containing family A member 3 isoform X2 [Pygocentrus nattereri]|uniref:pleckstrin homology domain-containing family A member 3 isoform X2 n=1 Tax=Pygocentrus nattereri TaxID=42514 RepID=UPI000814B28C|nr:pleckstrin homology domain-containing family A member 3 isoform X2 [Pygocentrus nattereri]